MSTAPEDAYGRSLGPLRATLLRRIAAFIATLATAIVIVTIVTDGEKHIAVGACFGALLSAGCAVLAKRGHTARVALPYIMVLMAAAAVVNNVRPGALEFLQLAVVYGLLAVVSAMLVSERALMGLGGLGLCLLIVTAARCHQAMVTATSDARFGVAALIGMGLYLVEIVCLTMFLRPNRKNAERLHRRVAELELVVASVRVIGDGDLSRVIEGDGDASAHVRAMQTRLREMVAQIGDVVQTVASNALELSAMARELQSGAVTQASAVQQIGHELGALSSSSTRVATTSAQVLEAAERSQETHGVIAHHIEVLASHSRGVHDVLDIIRDVANKSEVLALNAALEGVRAGEGGAGFSLVAQEMQRLAEDVLASVQSVRTMVADITHATDETVASTTHGAHLTAETTSFARRITSLAVQQRASTRQASAAAGEIEQVSSAIAASSEQTLAAAEDLTAESEKLRALLARFHT